MIPELVDVAEKVKSGRPVEPVTVRTFLWWFGAQKRGYNIVARIRQALDEAGIETYPDFEDRWVDAPISFQIASSDIKEKIMEDAPVISEEVASETTMNWVSRDPTHRISKLAAANQKVVYVSPDADFREVVTLLLARDFSQLPVMVNERGVKGDSQLEVNWL